MDTATLVNFDIENGKEVIDALDRDGKTPNVALWAKIPDYEDWRLVIASGQLDQTSSLSGYTEINESLKRAGFPFRRKPTISLRPWTSPSFRDCAKPSHRRSIPTECASGARCSATNTWKTRSSIAFDRLAKGSGQSSRLLIHSGAFRTECAAVLYARIRPMKSSDNSLRFA